MRFTTLSNYHLIDWLTDDAMFVRLLDELILGFVTAILTWETGGFELTSTITLVLQANRQTKCFSHPKCGRNVVWIWQKCYYYLLLSKIGVPGLKLNKIGVPGPKLNKIRGPQAQIQRKCFGVLGPTLGVLARAPARQLFSERACQDIDPFRINISVYSNIFGCFSDVFFLQRVGQWFKAFQLSQEGFLFKPHWVLSWVFGPNLVTSVLVTLGFKTRNRGLKVAQRWWL